MRQLPLGVQLAVSLRFDSYTAGDNGEAVDALRRLADGVSRGPVWIYGAAGPGKSHLLQAACAQAGSQGTRPPTCRSTSCASDGPAILDGFERLDLVALDDLDAIAGDDAWEFGLFTLFNGLMEHGGRLASAALRAPASVGFACRTSPRAFQHRRCIAWSRLPNLSRPQHSWSAPSVVASSFPRRRLVS